MTKEEAIKVYNNLINQEIKEAFEAFAPELRESEDERASKELMNFIAMIKDIAKSGRNLLAVREKDVEMCDRFLAYLEKQKKQKPTNSYKPTHEQMEALRFAVNHLAKRHVSQSVRLSIMYDHLWLNTRKEEMK